MNRPFASFHQPRQAPFDVSVYLNTKSRSPTKAAQKRSEQITHLHHEFESLKKKIKEVENKNEKIIQKIHKSFNFKKKATGTYTQQNLSMNEPNTEQLVYYNQPYFQNSIIGTLSQQNNQTHDQKSNASNQSQYQFNMRQKKRSPVLERQKQNTSKSQDKNKFLSAFTKKEKMTQEYIFPEHKEVKVLPFRQQSDYEKKSVVGEEFPVTATLPVSLMKSKASVIALEDKIQSLQIALNLQKQKSNALAQQLQNAQSKIYQLQGTKQKFKGYAQSSKIIYETNFENFVENIARKWMLQIQRSLKKNQSKITNIFSMLYEIKDNQKDRRKSLTLKNSISHQEYQRTFSRQYRMQNQRERQVQRDVSRGRRQQMSKSRSKVNELIKKKQFEQIASQYEQIIKSKNSQIDKLDKKLKNKQQECLEFQSKIEKLNKQMLEIEDSKFTFMPEYVRTLSRKKSKATQQIQNQSKEFEGLESQILLYTQNYEKDQGFLENRNKHLELELKNKNDKIAELQQNIIELTEQKKILLQKQRSKETENQSLKNKKSDEFIHKIKFLEAQLIAKSQQNTQYQKKIGILEKSNMERQCQLYGYESKIGKIEGQLSLKCAKIAELQKLLANNEQNEDHNRSLIIGDQSDKQIIQQLKAEVQKLEDQLITKNNEVYIAARNKQYAEKKQKQFQNRCLSLQKQNDDLYKELQEIKSTSKSLIDQQENRKFDSDYEDKQQKIHLEEQLVQLTQKYNTLSRNFQQVKSETLEKDSKIIKLESELEYVSISDSQKKISLQKHKQQYSYLQTRNNELEKLINQKQMELEMEKKMNSQKIKQMEKQWAQFEAQTKNNMKFQLEDNMHLSQKSSVANFKNNFNRISTQNEYLIEKIKQVQSQLQMQKMMESKIIDQYKNNVEKIKHQIKQKNLLLEKNQIQIDKLLKKIGFYMQKEKTWQSKQLSTENTDVKASYEKALQLQRQRIQELQAQLRQTKQINQKLTDMSNQLFSEIKMRQTQNEQIIKLLQQKNERIRQLEQSHGNSEEKCLHLGSNNSHLSKTKQRDILKSQSSLRYSSFTQLRNQGRIDKTVDLDLSQAGSSFFDTSQIPLNISHFFEKQQFPYEKTKMKRKQQVKLFEKTAAYIKTLKESIDEKVKKIRVLEKKIASMKSTQLVRKELGPYELIEKDMKLDNSFDLDDNFRDYQSVQLQNKRGHHQRRYKILEHDSKLVIQENNFLVHQVQELQQQLEKAQQQENSLVKIKDLYKEEIKKLMKKTEQLEQDAAKLRSKIAESESVHHFETVKQLYGKIMIMIKVVSFESGKKKQQKKKQLGGLLQTMNKLLALDSATSTQILSLAKT